MSTLTARQLGCIRHSKKIVCDITFDLNHGEALLIEGRNGSGKSTLLRLLTGLTTPEQGDVLWQGQSIQTNRSAYHEQLHYIGHHNGLKLSLTVSENLKLIQHLATENNHLPLQPVLQSLCLKDKEHHLCEELSAGQKRRVALAKLFIIPKKIWVLDEPFTALDKETQQLLSEKITHHLQHQGIVILTSHQRVNLPDHLIIKTVRLST